MSTIKKIIKGSLYFFIGAVFAKGIAFLIQIYITRQLSVKEVGLFFSMFAFLSFIIPFRRFGTSAAMTTFISEYKTKKQFGKIKSIIYSAFTFQLIVSIFFVLVFWLVSPILAKHFFKEDSTKLFRIFSIFIITTIFYNIDAIFRGFQKSKLYALVEPVKNFLILVFIFIFFNLGLGILSPILAHVLSGVFLLLLFIPSLKKMFDFKVKLIQKKKIFITMIKYGAPLVFVGTAGKFVSYFDTLLLTSFSKLEAVGIYNIILSSSLLFTFIPTTMGILLMPIVSELRSKKEHKKIIFGMSLIYKYTFLFLMPALFAVITFSNVLITLVYGKGYLPGDMSFKILLVGVIFLSIKMLNEIALVGLKKTKQVMKINIYSAIINIILNLILIPFYGIIGAAIATSISFLLGMILSLYYIKININIKFPLLKWLITLVCSGIFLLVIYLIKQIHISNVWVDIIISLGISGIIYIFLTHTLRLWNFKELMKLLK